MKVSNNKIGPQPNLDTSKTGKSEGSKGLNSQIQPGSSGIKNSGKLSNDVQVSERAQMMNKAKGLASQDTVDEAKVARLQKLIDEGKYKVDADKIADRLVDEHLLIPD